MDWLYEEYCDYCGHCFVPGEEREKVRSAVFPEVVYTLCPGKCYEFGQEDDDNQEDCKDGE